MGKILTVEDVLNTNELVLVDTSMNKGGLCRRLYDINYDSLEIDALKRCYESSRLFLEILNHPNTMTIPEVTRELKRYYMIIKKKLAWLDKTKKYKTLLSSEKTQVLNNLSSLVLNIS